MAINSDHVTGFVVGVGACVAGYYYYRQNQAQVDEFLRGHGIELPALETRDYNSFSLEELVGEKEKLEDLIAERELTTGQADKKTGK
jgi:hypothetical protein